MMILRSGKGCNDPKHLEGVLPFLDRRLYDGGDGGVVLHAGLCPRLSCGSSARSLGKNYHGVQHIGHGAFAYIKTEYSLKQMRKPLERDVLISAQIGHECSDVRPEGCRSIDRFRKLPIAAVAASALDRHLKVINHFGSDRERNVNHLSRCTHHDISCDILSLARRLNKVKEVFRRAENSAGDQVKQQ